MYILNTFELLVSPPLPPMLFMQNFKKCFRMKPGLLRYFKFSVCIFEVCYKKETPKYVRVESHWHLLLNTDEKKPQNKHFACL